MPRNSRIDAPGAIHHIIARGMERKKIFMDDYDRESFLKRLGSVISATDTKCYAWTLIPNHFHLLLKTGQFPLAKVMGKLLTGYAVSFNKRHKRSGHLFQNRYKSILCQEEIYMKELVRYIHLNPYRAKLVKSYDELNSYPFCGHAVIKEKMDLQWQDSKYVLSLFAETRSLAIRRYELYMKDGVSTKKRTDLTGGGLIRSNGGWDEVKRLRKNNDFQKSDERILGDGSFVEEVLSYVNEQTIMQNKYRNKKVTYDQLAEIAAKQFNIQSNQIFLKTKQRKIVNARNLFCYWSVQELNISMTELSKLLKITVSAISQASEKGMAISSERNITLDEELKL